LPEKDFGVKAVSLRESAGGYMLDFRYKVVDVEKAKALFRAGVKPRLVDEKAGWALNVPDDTKLGSLRSSPRSAPENGKQYYVLFGNSEKVIKKGSKVAVSIGDCTFRNVIVQ
jgi:hypothetical protein